MSTLSRRFIAHVKYQSELQRCIIVLLLSLIWVANRLKFQLYIACENMIHTILYLTLNYYQFYATYNYCSIGFLR